MTDAADLPADLPELEPAVTFDSARLIAEVRRGNEVSIREAYRITFGTALGRIVLLHALATIGKVGQPRGPETTDQANHTNGCGYAVLEIASHAGFDPVAISAAGLTQALEGASHEHGYTDDSDDHHGRGPRVQFDDGFDGGAEPDPGGGFDIDG